MGYCRARLTTVWTQVVGGSDPRVTRRKTTYRRRRRVGEVSADLVDRLAGSPSR